MSSGDPGSERPAKTRRVIHATCTAAGHGSGFGFTNLVDPVGQFCDMLPTSALLIFCGVMI
jgi:hypothetical protein